MKSWNYYAHMIEDEEYDGNQKVQIKLLVVYPIFFSKFHCVMNEKNEIEVHTTYCKKDQNDKP
jgi:hypothetical protein